MVTNAALALNVSAPVAGFRAPHAREYLETLPVPPPSTVYGMLLSLVGETNRLAHVGAELAFALLSEPERSTVLRTAWRVKDAAIAPGMGSNRRPDFQELLTDVRLAVFVRPGEGERAEPPLARRVRRALEDPASVQRFGGLCLGESTHLVDVVRWLRAGDVANVRLGRMLIPDREGDMALPVWPDHVGSAGTRWGQFRLAEASIPDAAEQVSAEHWIVIRPPG
jgi:CRISPR-associated protein Cas5t